MVRHMNRIVRATSNSGRFGIVPYEILFNASEASWIRDSTRFRCVDNIELSRPAVQSPAATQFTFPIPHYKPAVPGSASTTC